MQKQGEPHFIHAHSGVVQGVAFNPKVSNIKTIYLGSWYKYFVEMTNQTFLHRIAMYSALEQLMGKSIFTMLSMVDL